MKEDFCLPQQEDQCIAHGFHYGPFGLKITPPDQTPYQMVTPEPLGAGVDHPYDLEQSGDNLPIPPQIEDESLDSESQMKKENAFYFGVIAGVVVWILTIALMVVLYRCCKKRNASDSQVSDPQPESSANQYQDLAGQNNSAL